MLRHGTFLGASYGGHSFSPVPLLRVGMTWHFGFLLASLQRFTRFDDVIFVLTEMAEPLLFLG